MIKLFDHTRGGEEGELDKIFYQLSIPRERGMVTRLRCVKNTRDAGRFVVYAFLDHRFPVVKLRSYTTALLLLSLCRAVIALEIESRLGNFGRQATARRGSARANRRETRPRETEREKNERQTIPRKAVKCGMQMRGGRQGTGA